MSPQGQDAADNGSPQPGLAVLKRKASVVHTFKAVFWSFFGVRRHNDYQQDIAQLNPLHVAIAGIVAAAAFVAVLILTVRWVISSGVAT